MCEHLPTLFGRKAFVGKYLIGTHCGRGSFGSVVSARIYDNSEQLVIKIECGILRTSNEQAAYEALEGIPGIPRCHEVLNVSSNHLGPHGVIVLDRLGDNLQTYMQSCGRPLPIIEIYLLGETLVKTLQGIHGRGIVHRDIKPENILLPLNGELQPHLVDFGHAKTYRDADGRHKPQSTERAYGTLPFMSLNVHSQIRFSRQDDIVSLAYTLIHLSCGSLPWYGCTVSECARLNSRFVPSDLTPPLPVGLVSFLNYATNLGYTDDPDYNYLQAILNLHKNCQIESLGPVRGYSRLSLYL